MKISLLTIFSYEGIVELMSIDLTTSRMLSERSTI